MGGAQMNPKLLRLTLYLLLMGAVVTGNATAQPDRPASVYDTKAKFAEDYNAHKFKDAIADAAALQKLNAMDTGIAEVVAQAYYLSGDMPGCAKYIQENLDPSTNRAVAGLLRRCQAQP
jgi:hypothetical protein